jgi:hypothetical protein
MPPTPPYSRRVVIQTLYSPSHAPLYERWRASLEVTGTRAEIRVREVPQECATAEYLSPGWMETMHRKLHGIRDDLAELVERGEPAMLIHSDCDVQWFRDPVEWLADNPQWFANKVDARWQHDGRMYRCAGLGILRATDDALDEVRDWIDRTVKGVPSIYRHDQDALQEASVSFSRILPVEWWSAGAQTWSVWTPGAPTPQPPKGIVAHHANWCVGVADKLALMDAVRAKVEAAR